jgi:predicted Zn-dependent peptidase
MEPCCYIFHVEKSIYIVYNQNHVRQFLVIADGLRVVSEKLPFFKSVSIGLWIGSGSINETLENNGVSHFIEHMIFKGTNRHSARDIADIIDGVGGQINGFTAKECTCFYVKVMDEHIDVALDLLSDMVLNPKLSEDDIQKEKAVIAEEIHMTEDSPEDLVQELMAKAFFGEHPLGMPILGNQYNVMNMDKRSITEYYNEWYNPSNAVLAVAGSYDEDELIRCINKYFSGWNNNSKSKPSFPSNVVKPTVLKKEKPIEQIHCCISVEGLKQDDPDMYALLALNNIIGGGMSSRLFQKIREERGMAYSVFSYPSFYPNIGMFSVYAAINPSQINEVIYLIKEEIRNISKEGISHEEYKRAKEQLKGNYVLGLESTSNRMSALGRAELVMGRIYTPDEILQKIEDITEEQMNVVASRLFNTDITCAAFVGSIPDDLHY